MNSLKTAAVSACLAIPAPLALADLTVGDPLLGGDFPDLQSAVDAALEGEDIFILPGTYEPAVIDGKSLRLLGQPDGSVAIRSSATPEGAALIVRNLAPNQAVLLRGLDVLRLASPMDPEAEGPAIHLLDSSGVIQLHECRGVIADVSPNDGGIGPGLAVDNCQQVLAMQSVFEGSSRLDDSTADVPEPAGVRCSDSSLIAVGCQMIGHQALDSGFFLSTARSGSGLLAIGASDVRLHDCLLVGGDDDTANTLNAVVVASPAVRLNGASLRMTGAGSTLVGGSSEVAGPFLVLDGEPCLLLDDGAVAIVSSGVDLQPGLDASGVPFEPFVIAEGAAPETQANLEPFQRPGVRAVLASGQLGSSLTLEVQGESGVAQLVFFSSEFAGAQVVPFSVDPLYLDLGSAMLLGSLAMDGQGLGSLGLNVPTDPSLAGFIAWFQSFEPGSARLSLPTAFLVNP